MLSHIKFLALEVGDYVHDMHYGIKALELEAPLAVSNLVSVTTSGGSEFIEKMLTDQDANRSYTNKMAVVVDKRFWPDGFTVVFAWSYDDRYFGMFEVSEKKEG